MKDMKQLVLGVAIGITLFAFMESLFDLIWLVVSIGIIHWELTRNQKKEG